MRGRRLRGRSDNGARMDAYCQDTLRYFCLVTSESDHRIPLISFHRIKVTYIRNLLSLMVKAGKEVTDKINSWQVALKILKFDLFLKIKELFSVISEIYTILRYEASIVTEVHAANVAIFFKFGNITDFSIFETSVVSSRRKFFCRKWILTRHN